MTAARGSAATDAFSASSISLMRAVPARVAAATCPAVRFPSTSSTA